MHRALSFASVLLVSLSASSDVSVPSASRRPAGPPKRDGATYTTLRDGRVLVAGGMVDRVEAATAEVWDPKRGQLLPTSSMSLSRAGHGAVLLQDGRVLVVGPLGYNDPFGEIWNPRSGRWEEVPKAESHQGRVIRGMTATL